MSTEIVVSEEHAVCFGWIINIFAKIEFNMQVAAAAILGSDLGTAVILMGDMNYRQKRQTLSHLNQTVGIDGVVIAEITQFLDGAHRYSKLRNLIAHSIWTNGQRKDSIKPLGLVLRRDGPPKPIGHDHNEQDYTPEDLRKAANSLEETARTFSRFLESSGLESRVQAKIDAIKPSTSSDGGQPSSR